MFNTIDKYIIITFSIVNNPLPMSSMHFYNSKLFFKVHNYVLLGSCPKIACWKRYSQKISGCITVIVGQSQVQMKIWRQSINFQYIFFLVIILVWIEGLSAWFYFYKRWFYSIGRYADRVGKYEFVIRDLPRFIVKDCPQSIDLYCKYKSVDWFLYGRDLCHKRVKQN